jgi:hypothetical protein
VPGPTTAGKAAPAAAHDRLLAQALSQATLERSGSYPRPHGDGGGTAYTLQDCLRVRSSNRIFPGQGSETTRVTRILKGAFFEEDEALDATGISLGSHTLLIG